MATSPHTRLAIVATHPIQHFVPFYRALAAHPAIEPHVLYGVPLGIEPYFDAEMRTEIAWNMDMLAGYSSEFLENLEPGIQPSYAYPDSPGIAASLAAFAPDAILIYGYAQKNALRALRWGNRHRVPVMMISDSERTARQASVREAIKRVAIPFVYRRLSAFLSVGDNNEAYYCYYGAPADRIFRSPFTIDEAAFAAALARRPAARAALRDRLGIADDARVVLYVGKLYEGKRPGDLVAAMRSLGNRGDVHAVIAGNGEQFGQLRSAAAPNTHFLGFVNVDELPAIYAGADMLVVPSASDRHPLVCSEAGCSGLPMIISDRVGAVGPTDIARADENAIVYPCGDVAALAQAIAALAGDDARRREMGARSRAIFDTLDMAQSVRGVIDAIAAGRR